MEASWWRAGRRSQEHAALAEWDQTVFLWLSVCACVTVVLAPTVWLTQHMQMRSLRLLLLVAAWWLSQHLSPRPVPASSRTYPVGAVRCLLAMVGLVVLALSLVAHEAVFVAAIVVLPQVLQLLSRQPLWFTARLVLASALVTLPSALFSAALRFHQDRAWLCGLLFAASAGWSQACGVLVRLVLGTARAAELGYSTHALAALTRTPVYLQVHMRADYGWLWFCAAALGASDVLMGCAQRRFQETVLLQPEFVWLHTICMAVCALSRPLLGERAPSSFADVAVRLCAVWLHALICASAPGLIVAGAEWLDAVLPHWHQGGGEFVLLPQDEVDTEHQSRPVVEHVAVVARSTISGILLFLVVCVCVTDGAWSVLVTE